MRDIIIKSEDNKHTMRLTFHWDIVAIMSGPFIALILFNYFLKPSITEMATQSEPLIPLRKMLFYAFLLFATVWGGTVIKAIIAMSPTRQAASSLGAIIILIAMAICGKLLSVGFGDNPDSVMFYPMIFGFIVAFLFGLALMVLEPEYE
ncbi:MAG: hypothetical protein KKB74_06465 [Bacteroidetes bacterium]|nr:hypothetical protein [Bacteroidota bacterium]